MRFTPLRRASLAVLGVALLAGCSGGGGATGIASLSGSNQAATADAGSGTSLTEDKALQFSQCMRDNGLPDFPDPTVDADGNVRLGRIARDAAGAEDQPPAQNDVFRTAMQACRSILDGVTFGGGRGGPGGAFDNTALQDALVQFSDCLRGEGLDVGDLSFGAPNQNRQGSSGTGQGNSGTGSTGGTGGTGSTGGTGGTDQAQPPSGRRGPGGDPTQRMIERLGLDPNDPAVQAAFQKCQPILQSAFANARADANGNRTGTGQ
jgi:hypothetical protein